MVSRYLNRHWRGLALALIVALAAVLRCANLGALGYVNHYYSAGIVSLLQFWRNFFFVAAEPGGAVSIDKVDAELLAYLQAHTQGVRYLGGFMGQDQVLDEAGLAQLVASGELRYIYWGGEGRGGQSSISAWVSSSCRVVDGFASETRNMGAPGGIEAATEAGRGDGMGGFQIQLYDCAEISSS
jgi:hypothetical protein